MVHVAFVAGIKSVAATQGQMTPPSPSRVSTVGNQGQAGSLMDKGASERMSPPRQGSPAAPDSGVRHSTPGQIPANQGKRQNHEVMDNKDTENDGKPQRACKGKRYKEIVAESGIKSLKRERKVKKTPLSSHRCKTIYTGKYEHIFFFF